MRVLTNTNFYLQKLWVPLRASKPPLTSFVQHRTLPALVFSHECHFFQYAPVSGDIVGINEELGGQPSLLNKSPEDEGEILPIHRHKRRRSLHHRLAVQTSSDKTRGGTSWSQSASVPCPNILYLIA